MAQLKVGVVSLFAVKIEAVIVVRSKRPQTGGPSPRYILNVALLYKDGWPLQTKVVALGPR